MFYPVERWLSGPQWVRQASLLAFICAGAVFINYLSFQPQKAQIQDYSAKNQQASERMAKLRRDVISLISSTKVDEEHQEALPLPLFSVMELVQYSGGRLKKWQPENKPITLEILLDWQRLPATFAHFSHYSNVVLEAFSLEPQGEKLQLTVIMDIVHEA